MKAPKIAAIPDATPETSFTERAKAAKKTQKNGAPMVQKSFTISPDDVAFLEKAALDRGQKRGKSMNVSEALREVLGEARGQKWRV